jgi:hypothetical protein
VRVFFRAKHRRFPGFGVETACLLDDGAARVEDGRLASDLGIDGALNEAERIDVLELAARSERGRAPGANRNVRIAAKAALFEVAVVHTDEDEQVAKRAQVGRRLGARA